MAKNNLKDIQLLKNTIKESQKPIKRVWYYDVEKIAKMNNIDKFYQVKERDFLSSTGYILTKDGQVLLLEHKTNNVNTSYVIAELYRNFDQVKNNFFELYKDELQ